MRRLEFKPLARADIKAIRAYSRREFGPESQVKYGVLIKHAFTLLCRDPDRVGVRHRDDLSGAPCLFHLRYARMRGVAPKEPRHVIVFVYDDEALTVLRVLHESRNIPEHLKLKPE